MYRLNPFLFFATMIILASCCPKTHSLTGYYLYKMKNNPEIWEAVNLKSDSIFTYQFCNSFVPYPELKGRWSLKNDTVILNSFGFSVWSKGDTLRLKNAAYIIKGKSLRNYISSRRFVVLKKLHKTLLINNEKF